MRTDRLPGTPLRVLQVLLAEAPEVVPNSEIAAVTNSGAEFANENLVRVTIARLRGWLQPFGLHECVVCVRGAGYCWDESKALEVTG